MKKYNAIIATVILTLVLVILGTNIYFFANLTNENEREYRVEVNRLQQEIDKNGLDSITIESCQWVKEITRFEKDMDLVQFSEGEGKDYIIKEIQGFYYRFDYDTTGTLKNIDLIIGLNFAMATMAMVVIMVLFYLKVKLLRPFHKMKDVPYELSKGNLTTPLKENKSRFFGKFVWGLNLLRENLEEQHVKELELQKEKKTLVLSLSHDIKTPLSIIKLYAKAISKNLYDQDEKRIEIAESINEKADEIEQFVSQIIKASSEDFLNLQVENGEFYLKDLLEAILNYYTEKLNLLKIEFEINSCCNCLIKGDFNRSIEVLQNIIENAIKYGDGGYIRIDIQEEEEHRLITVSNSGCTLLEAELPHIFDTFWRGSNVGGNHGSGLGLSICRQLMKKMDGDIFAICKDYEMKVTAVFRLG